MPTVLLNKKSHPHKQNIFQNQSKPLKNGEAHGGVRQDKYADARVRGASDQPVTHSDPSRTSVSHTKGSRTKKRSRPGRLSQLATWVEDPIVFKVRKLARDKNLSQSKALRRIVIKGLSAEDGELDEALEAESLRESVKRDYRRLSRRLSWLLLWLLFNVSHIKAHTTNLLSMQKGMSEELFKDILKDADRHTKTRLSRKNPELTEFVDALEQWLSEEEDLSEGRQDQASRQAGPKASREDANGQRGRGGRAV
jgi:hypothetical protein